MGIFKVYSQNKTGLNLFEHFQKRTFDIFFSLIGLLATWWIILLSWLIASYDTKSNGFFIQGRVGRGGRIFKIIKIKTMRPTHLFNTTVTISGDPRVTSFGSFLRRTKLDELPQLWNILIGNMSFVGPRPDVSGFSDKLIGDDRLLLSIRPGITGPATLKYRDEERLLSNQKDPEQFNIKVIWPDKVDINLDYILNWSLFNDIKYIKKTIIK